MSMETLAAKGRNTESVCFKELGVDIRPFGYRVLIRAPIGNDKTAGGIYLPEAERKMRARKENMGLVLALGPDCFVGANFVGDAKRFEAGDWIYYSSYEKEEYYINDILCFFLADERSHAPIDKEDLPILLKDMR